MEVIDLFRRKREVIERDGLPPFEQWRLNEHERALWDEYFAGPVEEGEDALPIGVWSFGHACMLELCGPPDVVDEWLAEVDPDNAIAQYLDNVRRAHRDE